ncbi:Fic family protein [Pseudoduganella sp. FT26W]|uniref:Fic family protein n=1 Tax=Duganella aquatilis TaxID=2666082 RepID=A0A844D8K6_9BURK|nr:Fic family protein [Duganella aquatilis]MRW86365.1 Fic family protein [Duganella aquatilis]
MYDSAHQFEPLLLNDRQLETVAPLSQSIVMGSIKLTSVAHETTRATLRELVQKMNSFYSNRIEGQITHPRNIERALQNDFSHRPDIARLQRIALAHIAAEKELEGVGDAGSALRSVFLINVHRALYERLAPGDRLSDDGDVIIPGQIRTRNVQVSRHVPPNAGSLPVFLKRLDEVYDASRGWGQILIHTACLHQRIAWVHPFLDGNGRATRLQSHCALWKLSEGLWSPSRGLARSTDAYYAALHNADSPRRGDLDGRGNLSALGLLEWVKYFLGVCEDQVTYMSNMLALDGISQRIEALILFRSTQDKRMRREAILPLIHVFALGPVTRGEFAQLTGLGERNARSLLSKLLADGLLVSDTAYGPVRIGLPLDSLGMLFPNLYPEASLPLD